MTSTGSLSKSPSSYVSLKVISSFVGVIYAFLFFIKAMDYLSDGMLLKQSISLVGFILYFFSYIISTIPALFLACVLLYFYLRPIQQYDQARLEGNGEALEKMDIHRVRSRLHKFSKIVLIINLISFNLGLFSNLMVNQPEYLQQLHTPKVITYILFT